MTEFDYTTRREMIRKPVEGGAVVSLHCDGPTRYYAAVDNGKGSTNVFPIQSFDAAHTQYVALVCAMSSATRDAVIEILNDLTAATL